MMGGGRGAGDQEQSRLMSDLGQEAEEEEEMEEEVEEAEVEEKGRVGAGQTVEVGRVPRTENI